LTLGLAPAKVWIKVIRMVKTTVVIVVLAIGTLLAILFAHYYD